MPVKLLSVRVAPAAYGDGVYACRSFKRKERIGRVYGEVVGGEGGSEYAIDLGDDRLLEPGTPFRYLNHSCDPNCELLNFTPEHAAPHEYEVYVQATRRIAQGEQLTIDYAWAADVAIRCGCRSERCRGWIVNVDELSEVVARETNVRVKPR
jgi:hypothetical protein